MEVICPATCRCRLNHINNNDNSQVFNEFADNLPLNTDKNLRYMGNITGLSPWCQRGQHENCQFHQADVGYPTCQCVCHKKPFLNAMD
jgi:hypothetical protein